MSSLPSVCEGGQSERKRAKRRVTRALTNGLAPEVVCGVAEGELANDGTNVGGGLEEALEAGGDGLPAVETVLEHRRYGLYGWSRE